MPFIRRSTLLLLLLAGASASVADSFGEPISFTQSNANESSLAYTTEGLLVLWREEGLVRTKAPGGAEQVIATEARRAALATIGGRGLAAWTQDSGAVMVMRLSSSGTPVGSAVRLASNAAGAITVAASEDRYLVAWSGSLGDVYAAVVGPKGGIQVPAMAVSTQDAEPPEEMHSASDGEGFAVVWHHWQPTGIPQPRVPITGVEALLLDENAVPLSMTPILVSEHGHYPDVTSNGNGYFIVWSDEKGIGGRALRSDGAMGRTVAVTSDQDQAPRVAWDGTAYSLTFARTAYPRPGFSIPFLVAVRIRPWGAAVEDLHVQAPLFPYQWGLAAHDGRVDVVVNDDGGMTLQTAAVHPPGSRARAVRH